MSNFEGRITNVIHSSTTLSTPTLNNYLFAGEQFDPDLNLYYNRARYLNVSTGRFWSMDPLEGTPQDPLSLHKYLYTEGSPVGYLDPSGNQIADVATDALAETLDNTASVEELGETILEGPPPSPAPPLSGPPPTIPNAPAPVSFGSLIGKAVVTLTALSLAGDNPLPPTQPRSGGQTPLVVYRDADGPRGSDFRIDASGFSATGWGVSLLQQPQRTKRFIVPFTVICNQDIPLATGAICVVADPIFVSYIGNPLAIIYSPPEGGAGHWTLQAPADPAEQNTYKNNLGAYGKAVKIPTNSQ